MSAAPAPSPGAPDTPSGVVDPEALDALRAGRAPSRLGDLADLLDAYSLTPRRLIGGAVAVAALIAVVAVLLRTPSPPPEEALPLAPVAVAPALTTTAPAPVVVHVAGSVVEPGLRTLAAGARVADAIAAAGGAGPDADLARVNLAAPLVDGQRVYLPAVGEDTVPAVVGGGDVEPGGGGPVDLNRATATALDALPGVGPATAEAIIDHRQRSGGFSSVDDLLDVRGIGPAKLDQLRPLVTV